MTRKNILFCMILSVLTVLASTYYYMEQPLRKIANTAYTLYPLFTLHIVFPLLWGLFLFLFAWLQKGGAANNRIVRITIESFFLIANIISVFVNFINFFAFPSYSLILTGLLLSSIIFEIIQIFASKGSRNSPI